MGLNKKIGVSIWVVLHALLLIIGISVPWNVESDLYSVLPDSDELHHVSAAEKVLSARSIRNISVLVGHENFSIAKASAEALFASFEKDESFDEIRLHVDENAMQENRDFLFENRYVLQGSPVREMLKSGDVETLKNEALQKVYGAFSLADLNRLEQDPLLLGEQSFEYFTLNSPLMGGKFTLKEGVLTATDSANGLLESPVYYVMWSAVLSEKTPSMASKGHVLSRLDKALDSLQQVYPGLKVAKSGVPFHSYESSGNAQSEIAWISGISMALIILLLLLAFKTVFPLVATVLSIAVAAATALAGTWAIFGSIHIFTFVFGTSVIGVSIDYAIHFFTSWKNGVKDVRRHIFKGLLLGFMTTELSYIALTFAEFPLLRQMAVFSLIGLASSFATITLLFPVVSQPRRQGGLPALVPQKVLKVYERFPAGRNLRQILGGVFVVALLPGLYLLNVHTDMRALYSMSDELKAAEILNARLNNLGISANYFIVEGDSPEEVLLREESLALQLASAQTDSLLSGFLATSSFLPSVKTQKETWTAVQQLAPSVQSFVSELGIVSDSAFKASLATEPAYLTPESRFPSSTKSLLNMLWIGEVNGKFYSAVLPLHVSLKFDATALTQDLPKVYAVNKMANINATLTKLSHASLLLVAVAYVIVFLVLVLVYRIRQAVRIIRAPVLACLFLAAVFGYAGIDFNFFAIVGVILTLGIGIDYALFFKEGGRRNLVTTLAVMLSACTTLISFGSLAFSSFVPVATFGLATLLGIICCFILSPFSGE